jgi:ATP-dependent Clp protease ATP-binding subunit ClpC
MCHHVWRLPGSLGGGGAFPPGTTAFRRKGTAGMTSGEAFPVPTPRYGQLLGASFDVARAMQHPYVGVEHLFLAILRDRDAVPTQSLAMQIDLDEVEARLLDVMSSPAYRAEPAGPA